MPYHIINRPFKISKSFKVLPKWRNFTKSGYTAGLAGLKKATAYKMNIFKWAKLTFVIFNNNFTEKLLTSVGFELESSE